MQAQVMKDRRALAEEIYEVVATAHNDRLTPDAPGSIVAQNGWEDDGQGTLSRIYFVVGEKDAIAKGEETDSRARTFAVHFAGEGCEIEQFHSDLDLKPYADYLKSWSCVKGPAPVLFALAMRDMEAYEADEMEYIRRKGRSITDDLVEFSHASPLEMARAAMSFGSISSRFAKIDVKFDMDQVHDVYWMAVLRLEDAYKAEAYTCKRFGIGGDLVSFFYPKAEEIGIEIADVLPRFHIEISYSTHAKSAEDAVIMALEAVRTPGALDAEVADEVGSLYTFDGSAIADLVEKNRPF